MKVNILSENKIRNIIRDEIFSQKIYLEKCISILEDKINKLEDIVKDNSIILNDLDIVRKKHV